jgi:type II secretory pathway predicted ATPase ExeA
MTDARDPRAAGAAPPPGQPAAGAAVAGADTAPARKPRKSGAKVSAPEREAGPRPAPAKAAQPAKADKPAKPRAAAPAAKRAKASRSAAAPKPQPPADAERKTPARRRLTTTMAMAAATARPGAGAEAPAPACMYQSFFGLGRAPFSIAPDPRAMFMSERHREALAHLLYGVQGGSGGFVLLTGEIGAGKTTVSRCLLEQIPDHVRVAWILNPRQNADELLASICEEFGIRPAPAEAAAPAPAPDSPSAAGADRAQPAEAAPPAEGPQASALEPMIGPSGPAPAAAAEPGFAAHSIEAGPAGSWPDRVEPPLRRSTKRYVDALARFLLQNHARGRHCVLIIDEAQSLGADVLEQLRLLTNLETHERKLLQIVLIGQPELRRLLADPGMEQLAQRVVAQYHLGPLSEEETMRYIQHRMEYAGLAGVVPFDDEAHRRIFRLTRGVPRQVNRLCDRALLGAYAQRRAVVDMATVQKAWDEIIGADVAAADGGLPALGRLRPGWRPRSMRLAAAVAAAVVVLAALAWWIGRGDGGAPAQGVAAPAPTGMAPGGSLPPGERPR